MIFFVLIAVFPSLIVSMILPQSQSLVNSDPELSTSFATTLLGNIPATSLTSIDLTDTLDIPFSPNASLLASISNSSSSFTDLPFEYDLGTDIDGSVQCKGAKYGTNLVSCAGAIARISPTTATLLWGQRGQPGSQVKLPYRFMCMLPITSCPDHLLNQIRGIHVALKAGYRAFADLLRHLQLMMLDAQSMLFTSQERFPTLLRLSI